MTARLLIALCLAAALPLSGLSAEEEKELPVLLRSFATVDAPPATFEDGRFDPRPGETLTFIGDTNTFDQQKHPFLETLLSIAYSDRELKCRNLVWQGDSLYLQHRPAYFYTESRDIHADSLADQRHRIEPGIIFITFGKMESLDPNLGLPEFIAAYRELLSGLQTRSRRIVLVAPTPFYATGPAAALSESRNEKLSRYAEAIAALAAENNLLYVDTFHPLLSESAHEMTTDGIHLTSFGQLKVAELFAGQLNLPLDPGNIAAPALVRLTESITTKNRLWQQYYHPTNWAFLYGDRQNQPASRDHTDKTKRWFVEEIQGIPPLISEAEARIHSRARDAAARLKNR